MVILSLLSACLCFVMYGVSLGSAFNIDVLGSKYLIKQVAYMLGNASYAEVLARFYVTILSFVSPMLVLVILAAMKAWLLQRNVSQYEAWQMEIDKANKNTWILFLNLNGNFR